MTGTTTPKRENFCPGIHCSCVGRIARVVIPGVWHHVTQRGNRRQDVFFQDADRRQYLELLRRYCTRYGVRVTGYCLMTNHVHILAVPSGETSLARAFGQTHHDYARWLNMTRGDSGHLWQNRYFSCPMGEDYQWEALRYVELNPVRAGLVTAAEAWPWSSAAAHICDLAEETLLDFADWRQRWCSKEWREALSDGSNDAALLERIREATRTGRPAAADTLVKEMERKVGRRLRPNKRGPKLVVKVAPGQLELEIRG